MNKYGIHVSNGPIDFDDLEQMISVGASYYTLLHYQVPYLLRLRGATGGTLLVRYYAKNVLDRNPYEYAQEVATAAEAWSIWTKELVFANEINLLDEGGPHHADPDYAGNWLIDVATELRRLCPWATLHLPAFAPVGNWWEYFTGLVPWLDSFDVIDLHCYGSFDEMRAVVDAVKSQTDKPLFIAECNGPGTMEFFRWIEGEQQVIGATYYIWYWANPDLPGWDRDLRGSSLEQEMREAIKQPSNNSGGTMPLETEYPELYQQWVAAGGISNNFRSHLLALGILSPTKADLLILIDEAKSKLDQVRLVAQSPFQ